MNTIKTQKYEKITEELIASGYDKKEIDKVIDGLDDIEKGKTYTAQELYQKLFHKKKVYA